MKKDLFNAIRPGVAVLLLALLCLLPSGHAWAQSYTTSTIHYFVYNDACDSTIVRNWKDTAVFTCSHHPGNGQYSHTFHMRKSTVVPAKVFGLPVTINVYGQIIDRINDMRILDNECYFCGTRMTPNGVEIQYDPSGHAYTVVTYETCGFIGYYSFDNALNVLGTVKVVKVRDVKSALRMAVYNSEYNNNITCVEVLGELPSGTNATCMVEMGRTATNPDGWTYYVAIPDIGDEILTDVVLSNDLVLTASVYASNDGEIGFRHVKPMLYPFLYPIQPATEEDLYVYDTRNYTSTHFPNGFKRLDKAPVKLCARPYGFLAGFAGEKVSNLGNTGIMLESSYVHIFDMDWPSSMMEFQSASTLSKLDFKEMAYLSQNKAVGILYSSKYGIFQNDTRTVFQFPRLGAVSVGGQYTDTLMYNGMGDLHSMDTYRNHSASFGGTRQTGLMPLDGIQRQYDRSNSCFTFQGEKIIYRDPVLVSSYVQSGWEDVPSGDVELIEYQPVTGIGNVMGGCNH